MLHLTTGFESVAQCQRWLSERFRLVPQYDGELVHAVTPSDDKRPGFNSTTTGAVDFHNDAYDYARVPRYVALYCEQSARSGGRTMTTEVAPAVNLLGSQAWHFLRTAQVEFKTAPARYFDTPGTGVRATILAGSALRFSVNYLETVLPLDSHRHIHDFRDCLTRYTQVHELRSGDVLVFDNQRLLHAREAFTGPRRLYRFWMA